MRIIKINRLLNIIIYILYNNKVSAAQLARKFEVTKRTIYRDIEELSYSGIPLISLSGRNGGYTILKSYKLDKFTFSDFEMEILMEGSKLISKILGNGQFVIEEKLNLLYKKEGAIDFNNFTKYRDKIEIKIKNMIKKIVYAIKNNFKINITLALNTNIKASPVTLKLDKGIWYVKIYNEITEKTNKYKLTEIRKIDILDEAFDKNTLLFNESDNIKQFEKIKLVFQNIDKQVLYDYFLEEEIKVIKDNKIFVEFLNEINKKDDLFYEVLKFGSSIKVISPIWLKIRLENEIKKMYSNLFNSDI